MPRVILHIDRLVLRGVARGDACALSAALEGELQRLLALPGGLAGLQGRQRLENGQNAPGVRAAGPEQARVPRGAGPAAFGRAIAGCIAGGSKP